MIGVAAKGPETPQELVGVGNRRWVISCSQQFGADAGGNSLSNSLDGSLGDLRGISAVVPLTGGDFPYESLSLLRARGAQLLRPINRTSRGRVCRVARLWKPFGNLRGNRTTPSDSTNRSRKPNGTGRPCRTPFRTDS